MRTIEMSDYTVGEDCFEAIPETLASYGASSVVLVGGERAMAAAAPGIKAVLESTDIEVLDTIGKDGGAGAEQDRVLGADHLLQLLCRYGDRRHLP